MDKRAIRAAIGIALVAILIYVVTKHKKREHFASQRARDVAQKSKDMFDSTQGSASFSQFKMEVPAPVDAVLYSDVRGLWKSGNLTPETVQRVL